MNKKQLEDEIIRLQEIKKDRTKRYDALKLEIMEINEKLKQRQRELWLIDHNKEELEVTDHALMRYMERHRGVSRMQMSDEIMRLVRKKNPAMKDGDVELPEFIARVKNHTVVTIL